MEGLELSCFKIISSVGMARSLYIEAIQLAKQGEFEEAKEKIEEGNTVFVEGHQAHMELIQQECSGKSVQVTMLLLHAEDQLMSAEQFKILSEEFVEIYKRMVV